MNNKGLALVNENSKVYHYKYGNWNESDFHIEKTIFSPTHHKFSNGDIYFRPSQNGKGVRVQVFTGEGSNFYDQNFGAGTMYWNAKVVDINELINVANRNSPDAFQALKKLLGDMGLPIH